MVAVLGFSKEQVRSAVRDMYTVVANSPSTPLHFPIGGKACKLAGYSDEQISKIPLDSLESFAGVGCPFIADIIQPGQVVLDVGSGSGTDVILASRLVGSGGKVWALDLTPAMQDKLKETIRQENIENVEIVEGDAESIPLPDSSVDAVTSNGVLNLVTDKRKAISEIFRVLKPGGEVQIADIVISSPVTPDCQDDPKLWAECVVGATVDESYLGMFADAGFEEIEVLRDYDYFAYSPSRDTREVAKQFGAHGIEFRMRRGARAPGNVVQWARRLDPRRLLRDLQRQGLWGTVAFLLAVLACYGTLFSVALLSVLGASMAINNDIWAGSIILLSLITVGIIALGMRKHGSARPLVFAVVGAAVLVYTMYIDYNIATEILGFILLATATWFDFDLRRWSRVPGDKRGKKIRQV
jgi:ubiquinone/menaquinone biosynthesis C-methylase UbiE